MVLKSIRFSTISNPIFSSQSGMLVSKRDQSSVIVDKCKSSMLWLRISFKRFIA